MAQQVSLLPAVTLISQLFFVTFFGFLGLFLALPLTVVAKIWVQEVLVKDILDEWRHDRPSESELVIVSNYSQGDDPWLDDESYHESNDDTVAHED